MLRSCKHFISTGVLLISALLTSPADSAALQNGNGTIPYHFKDGEVISADVMNDLFTKIKEVAEGFSSPEDLVGVWSCTTYTTERSCGVAGFLATPRGILKSKTQTITFSCDDDNCTWTAAEFWPGSCRSDITSSKKESYDLTGDVLISLPAPEQSYTPTGQVHSYKRLGPNLFTWNITASLPVSTFVTCERQLLPPAIPSDLAASVTDATVTLTWTVNSSDETAFVILRKVGNGLDWTEIGTVAASQSTFSEAVTAGSYSYRVSSRNAHGDSLGSNTAVVTVP